MIWTLADRILLGPGDEARRLWRGALDARARASGDVVALCEALDLGVRAAEILLTQRLQGVKHRFPATIGTQLDTPEPDVDPWRDAVTLPRSLQFSDLIDLLGAEDLDCVAPSLHRGWEDRRFSCRRSRHTAQEALGLSLGGVERDRLLLLSAFRNRIFRCPPPVAILPAVILDAFDTLKDLVERLLAG